MIASWIIQPNIPFVYVFMFIMYFGGLYNLDTKNRYAFFPGSILYKRILQANLFTNSKKHKKQLKYYRKQTTFLAKWAEEHVTKSEETNTSHHWWYRDLTKDAKKCFDNCVSNTVIQNMFDGIFSPLEYDVVLIPSMNELYLTGKNRQENPNSDQVFFTPHIDGPFSLFPFVSVYRCMIGLNSNKSIHTHFPMNDKRYCVDHGDIIAFDFNREIHYITEDKDEMNGTNQYRVTIKVHYCIYPKGWHMIGTFYQHINQWYNSLFRSLFLKTITPTQSLDYLYSYGVVYGTKLFVNTDIYIGHKNIVYILANQHLSSLISPPMVVYVFYYTLIYKFVSLQCSYINYSDIEIYTFCRDLYVLTGILLFKLFFLSSFSI